MLQVAGFLVAALLRLQIERDSGVVGCPTDEKKECQCRQAVVMFVYIITEDHSTSFFTLTGARHLGGSQINPLLPFMNIKLTGKK